MLSIEVDVIDEFGIDRRLEIHDVGESQILALEYVDAEVSHEIVDYLLALLG